MRFEWFVARRYLRSPYRPAVLRLVTLFSIMGVAAGVATLVIALSMNTGFRETLQDRLLGVTAHVRLTRPGAGGIHDYEALTESLSASGVLLRLGEPLREGQQIDFLVEIPADTLDFSVTAAVHCSGRIVRSYWNDGQPFAAAVIDEYRFQ